MSLFALSLWNPSHVTGLTVLVIAVLLGMVHGITPDEHTWPITFSYAVGSYSTRRGLRAGLIFSLAFTVQRALTSELAYLGLSRLFTFRSLDNVIYLVVGVLMAAAGLLIVGRGRSFHLHLHNHLPGRGRPGQPGKARDQDPDSWLRDPRPWMPAVHGFVAGWGFGAFAIIIYTVLAPAMPSAGLGWVPGALFGLGTTLVQMGMGATFGWVAARLGLSAEAVRHVALITAARTLTWGGAAFVAAGIFGLAFPYLADLSWATGLHVPNLDSIGLPLVLVILAVVAIGGTTLVTQTRARSHRGNWEAASGVLTGRAASQIIDGLMPTPERRPLLTKPTGSSEEIGPPD